MRRQLLSRFLLATGRAAPDLSPQDRAIIARVKPETRTSRDRLAALIAAVRHVARRAIPGAVVECGVWRGGSMMAAALTLLEDGVTNRTLWLYDTFAGMPLAPHEPASIIGQPAATGLDLAEESVVRQNMAATGYPSSHLRFVRGVVEDTIPGQMPDRIALLRLDTDWYASTRHELVHLYPRLVPGGILIVDDYGHWPGCRQAVDEYFGDCPPFLHRIDYGGRLVVKP